MAVNATSWGLLACCYRKSPRQLQARLLAPSSHRRIIVAHTDGVMEKDSKIPLLHTMTLCRPRAQIPHRNQVPSGSLDDARMEDANPGQNWKYGHDRAGRVDSALHLERMEMAKR